MIPKGFLECGDLIWEECNQHFILVYQDSVGVGKLHCIRLDYNGIYPAGNTVNMFEEVPNNYVVCNLLPVIKDMLVKFKDKDE